MRRFRCVTCDVFVEKKGNCAFCYDHTPVIKPDCFICGISIKVSKKRYQELGNCCIDCDLFCEEISKVIPIDL